MEPAPPRLLSMLSCRRLPMPSVQFRLREDVLRLSSRPRAPKLPKRPPGARESPPPTPPNSLLMPLKMKPMPHSSRPRSKLAQDHGSTRPWVRLTPLSGRPIARLAVILPASSRRVPRLPPLVPGRGQQVADTAQEAARPSSITFAPSSDFKAPPLVSSNQPKPSSVPPESPVLRQPPPPASTSPWRVPITLTTADQVPRSAQH